MFRGHPPCELQDENKGPIVKQSIHVLKAKLSNPTFSLLVMTSWESMALSSTKVEELLLFVLCDLFFFVFIYGGIFLVMTSWELKNHFYPSGYPKVLMPTEPERPFENLMELQTLSAPVGTRAHRAQIMSPLTSEKISSKTKCT